MSLEDSVRAMVPDEMKRVLREELRAAIEEIRSAPHATRDSRVCSVTPRSR